MNRFPTPEALHAALAETCDSAGVRALEGQAETALSIALIEDQPQGACASRFGGTPDVPKRFKCPKVKGKLERMRGIDPFTGKEVTLPMFGSTGGPMRFMAQFDLEELSGFGGLPEHGLLSVFAHPDTVMGQRQFESKGVKVFHWPDKAALSRFTKPARGGWSRPAGLRFEQVCTVPGPTDPLMSEHLGLSELGQIGARLGSIRGDQHEGSPLHQLLGHAFPIQRPGLNDPERLVATLPRLPSEPGWRLLLQLDSDERLSWYWGDSGMLYLWIREEDLAAGRFDDVRAEVQTY